jgi:hypothetical protein
VDGWIDLMDGPASSSETKAISQEIEGGNGMGWDQQKRKNYNSIISAEDNNNLSSAADHNC